MAWRYYPDLVQAHVVAGSTDEAQQEAALSDLATLGALPRKCLVLRLGDPKQTSGGTGPSDLARRVRLVSDQLALGIRAPRKPCLPQAIPALIQLLLQDDLPQACCPAPQNVAMAENPREADVDGAPPIGGKPSTDALLSAESAPATGTCTAPGHRRCAPPVAHRG